MIKVLISWKCSVWCISTVPQIELVMNIFLNLKNVESSQTHIKVWLTMYLNDIRSFCKPQTCWLFKWDDSFYGFKFNTTTFELLT